MLWGGLELAAKGPDLGEDSLGKQSRRKSIVQPFRFFYSLGDAAADLGHPPSRHSGAQQPLRPAGSRFAARHAGGKEASAEAAPVGLRTGRMGGQGMEVGIEAVENRGPFLRDQAPDFPGVKQRG